MKVFLPIAAFVVGIVLLVVGLGWSSLVPPASAWSPEKNDKLSSLGGELKLAGFKLAEAQANPQMHGGEGAPALKEKHDKIKSEYDALQAEFESARDRPANTGNTLKWVGVIIAGISAVFLFLNKQDA